MEHEPKFEYAISAGEGTLLRYGADTDEIADVFEDMAEKTSAPPEHLTMIIGLAADDCVTGQ